MDFPWLALGVLGTAGIAAAMARLTRQYAAAAVAGAAVILWLHGWGYFHYTSDDAYISYRYARNLADGAGLVWNPGEHVEGYSNFLWVMILALADKLGAEIVPAGRWIGFALALPALAGTYWVSRELLDGAAGRTAGLAATLLLAASPPFAVYTFAGLEQSLFVSLMLAAVLLHLREQEGARVPLSGAAWALVAMTRPEGPLLFAVSGAFKLGEAGLRVHTQGGWNRQDVAREARLLVLWAAGYTAIYAPYFIWRYAEYGYVFPNSYYAKVGSGLDQYERGLGYLASFAREQAAWLLLLAPAAIALTSIRRARALYVLTLVAVWLAYVVYVGGDSLVRYRFFAPVLPLTWALIAASAGALLRAVRVERPVQRWAGAAIALAVTGLIGFLLQSSTDGSTAATFEGERLAVEHRTAIGRWLRNNVPDTTSVALIAAGAIPYESRLVTIDMLGINDEHIAHRDLDIGRFSAGHEKYDTEYVLDRRPDIIILFDGLTAAPMGRGDYAVFSNSVIPAAIAAANSSRLWQEYEARAVSVGRDRWFNLLVRHEASAVLEKTRSAQDAAAP